MARLQIIILLLTVCGIGMAQSSQNTTTKPATQPSSIEPFTPKQEYQPKKQKPTTKTTYNARNNFYDRMEQVAKANRKAEKELQKPQYSDPSYFGHKKPPKRRPNGQLKYCKECGIRH